MLVLNEVLVPLTEELYMQIQYKARLNNRDANAGDETHSIQFMDDCGKCVHVVDVIFFVTIFKELASSLGFHQNIKKYDINHWSVIFGRY